MRESEYLEGNTQLVAILKELSAFQNFENENIEKLIRYCKLRSYSSEELIIKEGDTDKSVYLLISGSVRITKNSKVIIRFQKAGEIFGEMGFIVDQPRSASAIADEDTSCLVFDGDYLDQVEIEDIMAFKASIYRMFAQILANRLRATTREHLKTRQKLDNLTKRTG